MALINNKKFKEAREKFTEQQGIGVNASRQLLADAADLKSIQRIIDYETDPSAGLSLPRVKALAEAMGVGHESLVAKK